MHRAPFVLALLLVSLDCSAQSGECLGPVTHWQPCARCTYDVYKTTKRDTPCHIGIVLGSAADVLHSQHVIVRPNHGAAGVSGATYIYSPSKGFVGQDSFKLERVFLRGSGAFVSYMVVHMNVMP